MFIVGTNEPSRNFGTKRQGLVRIETEKKATGWFEKPETKSRRNISPVIETADTRTNLHPLRAGLCDGQKKTNTCQRDSGQVFVNKMFENVFQRGKSIISVADI
ncbi:hypothetical protein D3C87_1796500 [compost metagenome]